MMFEIDFKRLMILMLPAWLRKPMIFGLLRAGTSAIETLYGCFKKMRMEHVVRLTHNGQVCYLRGVLKYYFGDGFEVGSVEYDGEWLYAVTESSVHIPVTISEKEKDVPVLSSEQMMNMAQNEFIVFVPSKYWSRLQEIEALVDRYKLPSKKAQYIKTYNTININNILIKK